MALQKKDQARQRKRKARTEVSSASDSSSESEKSSSPPPQDQNLDNKSHSPDDQSSEAPQSLPVQLATQLPKDPERAFEEFYLKQATKEFANDIDKLRSAPDFKPRTVPVLIRALRQGTACFSTEERAKVGAAR